MWGQTGKGLSVVSKAWWRRAPKNEETYDEEVGLAAKEEKSGGVASREDEAAEGIGHEEGAGQQQIGDDKDLYLWAGLRAARVTGAGPHLEEEERQGAFSSRDRKSEASGGGPLRKGSARETVTERDIFQEFEHPSTAPKTLVSQAKNQARDRWRHFSLLRFLRSTFPIIDTLKNYKKSYLNADFFSGLAAGVMAVPMGMSYSLLAKLPPQYGLYVGLFYPLVYMVLGTGIHVNVGVSAIEDLLAGEAVSRIIGEKDVLSQLELQRKTLDDLKIGGGVSQEGEDRGLQEQIGSLSEEIKMHEELLLQNRIGVSIGLCVCVGIVYVIMRIVQAGLLADLLSVPVLSGFSTASAFLIGTSQLRHLTGLVIPPDVENADFKIIRQWWYCLTHVPEFNWAAVGVCVASILILALCKFLSRRYFRCFPLPGPLIIVALFTAVTYGWRLDRKYGLKVIGKIPDGFPSPKLPSFSISVVNTNELQETVVSRRVVFLDMLREALPLTAMFFIIHISIAKTITQQKKTYQIDPDQELVALSCCNFVGSFFQCFPCATSLSRTSVISSTGARTQLHNISSVLVLVLTLSVITPLLFYLPSAVLASVVLFGVYGMMDFKELIQLCRIGGLDVLLWLVCFFITVIFGAMEGILASIVLSLLWLLRKTARPQCCVLGRLPQTHIYRNVARFPMAKEEPGIKVVRFDASLNFSNSDFFDSRVRQNLEPDTRFLIIDGSSINDLDVTSIRMLQRLCSYLHQRGIVILFANWKGPMRDFLRRARFYENTLPAEHCFLSLHDAVFWAKGRLAAEGKLSNGGGFDLTPRVPHHPKADEDPLLETTSCLSLEQDKTHRPPAADEVGASAIEPPSVVVMGGAHRTADTRKHVELEDMADRIGGEDLKELQGDRERVGCVPVKERKTFFLFRNKPVGLHPKQEGSEGRSDPDGSTGQGADPEVKIAKEGIQRQRAECNNEQSTTVTTLGATVPMAGEATAQPEEKDEGCKGLSSSDTSCSDGECGRSGVEMPPVFDFCRRRSVSDVGCRMPARLRRLNSAASTAKTLEGAGTEEDCGLLGGRTVSRGRLRSLRTCRRGNEEHTRREELGWDGLSASDPRMIRVVTEVTGTGSRVSWAVLKTGAEENAAYVPEENSSC